MNITLYTSQSCVWCIELKKWLDRNYISYDEIDISFEPKLVQYILDKTGEMKVPVIEMDGKFITGFNMEELEKELKIK